MRFLSRGLASTVLGGWQTSTIFTASSGFPLAVVAGSDRANVGTGAAFPNATGASVSGPQTTAQWFNIRAFQLQPLGTFGNAGPNSVIGPGLVNWDFSILKDFTFTESKYLQFRFEAFNFVNHPNWGQPGNSLGSNSLDSSGLAIPGTGSFGVISSTSTQMRRVQVALKLVF